MGATGRARKVADEPFTDLMVEAFREGVKPSLPEGMDFNPWGNNTVL